MPQGIGPRRALRLRPGWEPGSASGPMCPGRSASTLGGMRSDTMCLVDPSGTELHWPVTTPLAIGVFTLCIGLVVALERHEFTSPNPGLLLIIVIVLPWLIDLIGWPQQIMRKDARVQYPVVALWSAVVLGFVYWLSVSYYVANTDFVPFFLVLLIGEMAATVSPPFGAAVLAACLAELLVLTVVNHFAWEGQVIWAFGFGIGWLGGTAYRSQLVIASELANAQTELAARAAEEERHRLAREIHDLIAHSLAVTMLQLSGARLALEAGDTEEAVAALFDAETAGRAAMAEIHRSVGLLGQGGEDPPTPNACDIPELVDGFQRAGLQVRFDLEGELTQVPLASGLATYRVVQESLSNSVKHAPGAPVDVSVRVGAHDVAIRVLNPILPGSSAAESRNGSGQGLRGMAERAELLGGSARATGGDGTWRVDARIPWEEPA
jgi:signal transduction histidine kinase